MQDYHKLQVWQKTHHLTLAVDRVTGSFPKAEIACDLGYLPAKEAGEWLAAVQDIKRMLTGLLKKLKTDN